MKMFFKKLKFLTVYVELKTLRFGTRFSSYEVRMYMFLLLELENDLSNNVCRLFLVTLAVLGTLKDFLLS